MVYGDCYAANSEVYKNVLAKIKAGVLQIPNIEFAETKELGKLRRVDPLGITLLRVRGLWHITNPARVFGDVLAKIEDRHTYKFHMVAVMRAEKYALFPEQDRSTIENLPSVTVRAIRIYDPDNPANLLDAVAIICMV